MKKLILIAFLLFIFSCSDNSEYSYKEIKETIGKCHNNKNVTLRIKYPKFKNNKLLSEEINNFIITDYSDVADTPEGIIKIISDDYKALKKDFPDSKIDCWFLDLSIKVVNKRNDIITFKQVHSQYMGGGHDNKNIYYIHYNLKTENILSLEDITTDIDKLTNSGKKLFYDKFSIKTSKDLYDNFLFKNNKFYLSDNFIIDEENITFIYNPYEIASFDKGIIKLEIPLYTITDILKK